MWVSLSGATFDKSRFGCRLNTRIAGGNGSSSGSDRISAWMLTKHRQYLQAVFTIVMASPAVPAVPSPTEIYYLRCRPE
ncbi:MAG: hypothetical protein JO159_08655 [Acidobacteria bacterium]|nr:hypothetical protein [Acidobacteriota bacterium]